MNAIYLKRDTYVVCTFQMNTEPRKFIEDRPNANVSKGERMLLTTKDRNLDSPFICKKPMNQAGSFLALGAGILLVAATGAIGWVTCGFLLVGLYFSYKSCTHDCSNPLKADSWRNKKNGVYFNGGVALPSHTPFHVFTDYPLREGKASECSQLGMWDALKRQKLFVKMNFIVK